MATLPTASHPPKVQVKRALDREKHYMAKVSEIHYMAKGM